MYRPDNRPSNPSKCLVAKFNHLPGGAGQAVELSSCKRYPKQLIIGQLGGMNVYKEFGKEEGNLTDKDRAELLGRSLGSLCDGCEVGKLANAVSYPSFGQLVEGRYIT